MLLSGVKLRFTISHSILRTSSLRSWRDFACKCLCFGSEAVNASGEAVRGLVKSPAGISLPASPLANSFAGEALEVTWQLYHHSPAHEFRQLRRLSNVYLGRPLASAIRAMNNRLESTDKYDHCIITDGANWAPLSPIIDKTKFKK